MRCRHFSVVAFMLGSVSLFAQAPSAPVRAAAQAQTAQSTPSAGPLPVRRVVLYKTGVG
jgi:hypothetical protein